MMTCATSLLSSQSGVHTSTENNFAPFLSSSLPLSWEGVWESILQSYNPSLYTPAATPMTTQQTTPIITILEDEEEKDQSDEDREVEDVFRRVTISLSPKPQQHQRGVKKQNKTKKTSRTLRQDRMENL